MARKINFNYLNRAFETLKEDLKSYVKLYYPNEYNDFSESSVGMMLLELNAYVGDILSYHVDTKFDEVFLDSAVNRDSVIRIAKNLGYNPRGRSPSATLVDLSITVPVTGDTYDPDYLLTFEKNLRVSSTNGQTYEVVDEVNFASHTSLSGIKNRTIIPNYNASNEIESYTITKTVTAVAGVSKIKTLEVSSDIAVPFMKWYPDNTDINITEIMDVVSSDSSTAPETEDEWGEAGSNVVWYQVDSLPQERVFTDTSIVGDCSEGYWKYITERFIAEYDKNGHIYLTFGAGIKDDDIYADYLASGMTDITKTSLLNNDSLGSIPQIGTYLHCRYRTGGGPRTNAAQGTITNVLSKSVSYVPGGVSLPAQTLSDVIQSLSVTNPIPAIGGRDFETIDEMKMNARGHFASQDRCVTVDDYISRVSQMPSKYGVVFRSYAEADPESMNTSLYILTRDENGKLKNTGNEQIKYNLASYLSNYKILNDFVKIKDGKILNLGIKFVLHIQADYNKQEVILNCINLLRNYFAVENWQMNSAIYISQVSEMLRQQPGVVNVVSLNFYNKVGGNYSKDILGLNQNMGIREAVQLAQTGEVELAPVNNAIKAPITGMFEIKYPELDIQGAAITV